MTTLVRRTIVRPVLFSTLWRATCTATSTGTPSTSHRAFEDVERATALTLGPTAWRGPELAAKPSQWVTELSEAEISELGTAIEATRALPIADVHEASLELPTLSAKLRHIKHSLINGRGIWLLRNLPVDRWTVEESARAFWLIGLGLGGTTPVSQNKQGHLLGHVRDLGNDPRKPETRIYTTSAAQPYHTDSADVVGLMCIAPAAHGGSSQVVSSHAVFATLARTHPDLAAELLRTPTIWDRKGEVPLGAAPWFAVPAFAVSPSGQRLCAGMFDRSFVDAAQVRFTEADVPRLSERLREALDEAERLAADPELVLSMRLRPGDVQLLHSHQTWHSRSSYQDDATAPRHLLRLWLSVGDDGWDLPPEYAARYGTVDSSRSVARGGVRCPGVLPFVPLTPWG